MPYLEFSRCQCCSGVAARRGGLRIAQTGQPKKNYGNVPSTEEGTAEAGAAPAADLIAKTIGTGQQSGPKEDGEDGAIFSGFHVGNPLQNRARVRVIYTYGRNSWFYETAVG